jgi:hypothetical protein
LQKEEKSSEAKALNEIIEADRLASEGAIPKHDSTLMTRNKRRAVARVLSAMFTARNVFDDMNEIDPEVGRIQYPQRDRIEFMWEAMKLTNYDDDTYDPGLDGTLEKDLYIEAQMAKMKGMPFVTSANSKSCLASNVRFM